MSAIELTKKQFSIFQYMKKSEKASFRRRDIYSNTEADTATTTRLMERLEVLGVVTIDRSGKYLRYCLTEDVTAKRLKVIEASGVKAESTYRTALIEERYQKKRPSKKELFKQKLDALYDGRRYEDVQINPKTIGGYMPCRQPRFHMQGSWGQLQNG